MEFDHFTVVLLELRPDAPQLDDTAANALQDAHLDHLVTLHEQGYLLAAGPLDDPHFRGLSVLPTTPEEALRLKETDPAVQAGRFSLKAIAWQVPAGAIAYSRTRFPHSKADVMSDRASVAAMHGATSRGARSASGRSGSASARSSSGSRPSTPTRGSRSAFAASSSCSSR